jgi:hypothetical protein
MTAKTDEREKPQGPATSFVVACAFAPVAGALGYKRTEHPGTIQGEMANRVRVFSREQSG